MRLKPTVGRAGFTSKPATQFGVMRRLSGGIVKRVTRGTKGARMLVLTRKPSETIRIGDDILVTVVSVRGESVRLGITAPKDVAIVRTELDGEMVPRPTGIPKQEDESCSH